MQQWLADGTKERGEETKNVLSVALEPSIMSSTNNSTKAPTAASAAPRNPSTSSTVLPKKSSTSTAGARNTTTEHKTLGSLLHYWVGLQVAVELKTGGNNIYKGILASADHDMTVTLEGCTVSRSLPALYPPPHKGTGTSKKSIERDDRNDQSDSSNNINKSKKILHSVQIRGSQVRYIHFLDAPMVDLALTVKRGMERERAAAQKYKRGVRRGGSNKT